MPLYEFWCQACGYEIEKIVSIKDSEFVSCPKCGAKMTKKMGTRRKRNG